MSLESTGKVSEPSAAAEQAVFAGFWRRVIAFLIDTLLLGLLGLVLGLLFESQFVELGQWGRVVGFAIAGAYFIPADSQLFNGQSVGKRLLGLRVQGVTGALISLPRSALRYVIFGAAYFANGVFIETGSNPGWAINVLGGVFVALLMVGLLGSLYLLVFNRPSRRTLHDLLTSTVVVRASSPEAAVNVPLAGGHWVAIAAIPTLVVGVLAWANLKVGSFAPELAAAMRARGAVATVPGVTNAGVVISTFHSSRSDTATTNLVVNAWVKEWPPERTEFARRLALAAADEQLNLSAMEQVIVVIHRGYDIGLASLWRKESFSYPAKDIAAERSTHRSPPSAAAREKT